MLPPVELDHAPVSAKGQDVKRSAWSDLYKSLTDSDDDALEKARQSILVGEGNSVTKLKAMVPASESVHVPTQQQNRSPTSRASTSLQWSSLFAGQVEHGSEKGVVSTKRKRGDAPINTGNSRVKRSTQKKVEKKNGKRKTKKPRRHPVSNTNCTISRN